MGPADDCMNCHGTFLKSNRVISSSYKTFISFRVDREIRICKLPIDKKLKVGCHQAEVVV
jgi:hypothetical protein